MIEKIMGCIVVLAGVTIGIPIIGGTFGMSAAAVAIAMALDSAIVGNGVWYALSPRSPPGSAAWHLISSL